MSRKTETMYAVGFADGVLHFIDGQYKEADARHDLANVRNKHEAYGIMAEKYVIVSNGAAGLNRSLKDALGALPDSSEGFASTCEMAYNACIETAMAAIDMAIHMQNIIGQIAVYEHQSAGTPPLVAMAAPDEFDGETIPDDEE